MEYLRLVVAGVLEVYLRGFRVFKPAILIPLLVILPEFAQHIAEINMGMFISREAAIAVANEPLRWSFGYAKILGLILAIFAAARYSWKKMEDEAGRGSGAWWCLSDVRWGLFALALAGNVILFFAQQAIAQGLGGQRGMIAATLFNIATLPALIWLIGPLFGDAAMDVRRAFTRGWRCLLPMLLYVGIAFVPAQFLHGKLHAWSFGAQDQVVWALMVIDSLVVGVLAMLVGAALAVAYRFHLDSPTAKAH